MYGRAARTSITVVSKFPTKTWGAAHARTVDTRRSSPQLPRAPGNEAKCACDVKLKGSKSFLPDHCMDVGLVISEANF